MPSQIARTPPRIGSVRPEGLGLIKSIDKAVGVLQALYGAHRPLRVSELAKTLSLSPSVVSRIVATLCESGLLDQDGETGGVRLGMGLVLLGNRAVGRRQLDLLAIPVMARLAEQFEEYVSLSRLVAGKMVVVRGGPVDVMARDIYLTAVIPIHATAPGKLLAAWLSEEELAAILEAQGMDACTPNTITSLRKFREELAAIRRTQVAYDDEEIVPGLRHVATPVFDHDGQVVAALSAGGPVAKMNAAEISSLQAALMGASLQISRQLGYPAARPLP